MESVIQRIQEVHSINDIRDIKLTTNILTSIENIHNCIKNGSDSNGWKKVEWRNGTGKPKKPFANKPAREYSSSHSAFENRPKSSQSDSPSIPLTCNTPEVCRPQKYVSKFKKPSTNVDDTILNTILLGKLNKFSQQNYSDIKEFITHIIDNGETVMIKCFMKLVFEKAASEETFCPLYAKLLGELSASYPILLTEMDNLYSKYMNIFDEVSETTEETYNEFCTRNIKNKYRRGYSQFLAELIKYNIIDIDIFIKTVNKIISQIEYNCTNTESVKLNEEYSDCLMKITKAIKTGTDKNITQINTIFKTDILHRIQPLTLRNSDNLGMSNKARFTMLNIYEGFGKI